MTNKSGIIKRSAFYVSLNQFEDKNAFILIRHIWK